jgi:hypothetical protein
MGISARISWYCSAEVVFTGTNSSRSAHLHGGKLHDALALVMCRRRLEEHHPVQGAVGGCGGAAVVVMALVMPNFFLGSMVCHWHNNTTGNVCVLLIYTHTRLYC